MEGFTAGEGSAINEGAPVRPVVHAERGELGQGRCRRSCARLWPLPLTAVLALAGTSSAWGAPTVIYGANESANAIHAGTPGVPGLRNSLRQAPPTDNPRWPTPVLLGKASGNELAEMSTPAAMAAYLRANQRQIIVRGQAQPIGGWVGVDEIRPLRWTPARSRMLGQALDLMGPDADRVVFYVIAAYVEQSGRPRLPQSVKDRNAALLRALDNGGHSFFQMYRSTLRPIPKPLMSGGLTAIHARWPRAGRDRLHVLIGPSRGASQAHIFARVRTTAAGRAMLANGPGTFGLTTASQGRDWLSAYRAFLRSRR